MTERAPAGVIDLERVRASRARLDRLAIENPDLTQGTDSPEARASWCEALREDDDENSEQEPDR